MSHQQFAHYEVIGLLGRGGMGEVHRAKDTKLGREVALKLLPEDFATDPERLARFRREARLLASLQHANIASIFGIEEEKGQVFLVMELAAGDDLTQRIQAGPIPEDEVLDIARQLAAGLEEAHEKGVIHRDLKPANIKVSEDGKVKILDFGLARAFAGESAEEEMLENSPTITAAVSREGVILGTAAYMSPEQARGKSVDRRADIWAFGVVLFEMLTGERMFEGDTISDTLAGVLRDPIPWDKLPASTSPGVRRLLERCLERDPMRRLRDVGEARIFLEDGAKDSSILASASMLSALEAGGQAKAKGLPVWMAGTAALILAVAGFFVGGQLLNRSEPPPVLNTAIPTPEEGVFHLLSTQPGPAAISPDGSMVAFSVREDTGEVKLYLRRLNSPDATAMSGTEGAAYPFWSQDSRYIGFLSSDGKLKKVAVSGGPPVTLCAADNLKGGTWNADGVILFAPNHESGIHRVPATGGEAVEITTIDTENDENSHRHPRFMPDGDHYIFLARMSGTTAEHLVYFASLDGEEEPRMITTSQSAAEYSDGHLLTVREGILLATPFDPKTGELAENSVPIVEDILVVSRGAACGVYSPTYDGMLAYQISTGSTEKALEWSGQAGAQLGRVGDPGELYRPRLSPDGTQAVVELLDTETDTNDLWLVDLETGFRDRFTFDPGDEYEAWFTPDGENIVYTSEADSLYRILMRPVEGTGGATIVYESDRLVAVSGIHPDGTKMMLDYLSVDNNIDMHMLDVATGEVETVVSTERVDGGGTISPDGRWLAYHQQTSGSWEIIVRPLTGGNRKWQIDRSGGVYPFWAPDGKTLYYIEFAGDIAAVPVDGSGDTFRTGAPRMFAKVSPPQPGGLYAALHPDEDKVLYVSGEVSEDETGYLRLVTDWRRGLTK